MMQAVRSILDGGLSVKQVGIRFEIPRTPLSSYIKKCKNGGIDWQQVTIHEVLRMTPNYSVRQVFNENHEAMLADYFVCIADSQHEFLPAEVTDIGQPTHVGNQNAQDQAQPGSSHHNQKESQPLHRHHDQKTPENEMDITSMAPQRIG
ncbi:hypothetical protein ILUMI_13622 [Ignelater luminosus]|uniref:HTH psq-type domain-containing protein n=1 Tax=Ignelater luminosus TaxID=2038154 RepID=A0A8K0CVV6_IGNLU|nr:hypothetical protein ILUMI_13622 [Ignelater luminosus]